MSRQLADGKKKAYSVAFRTSEELKVKLLAEAEAEQRSVAQVIERRLMASYARDAKDPVDTV